ncbi:MAG: lipolytic protein family [Marmoricola sp.]|nr:lipolytic protein family [Marmoricola sp.]
MVVVAPASTAASPLRVLLTGDSITQGFHGDYTWRYRLAKEFARQHVAVNFVGSRRTPAPRKPWATATYADPNFDSDHFALVSSGMAVQATWIRDEVTKQQPDVIVIAAGVNDLRNGLTPTETDVRLEWWIKRAREAKPNVRIIVSPVLQSLLPGHPELGQEINEYNALARDTVASKSTSTSPITMADTTRGWSVSAHTSDSVHPTPTGETLIAQRIAETFKRLGILKQTPNIYRWTSWNRQPRVRVVVRNQRAVLSWDDQSLTGVRVSIRRAGRAAYYSKVIYTGGTTTTTPLAAGTAYEFRISMMRGPRMITPLGPITRATVPGSARPAAVSRVVVDTRGVHWTRSAAASSYLVKFRRAHKKRWVTRRTTGLHMLATNVVRARVWAVNGVGRSRMRAAHR